MRDRRNTKIAPAVLAAYVDGEVTPSQAQEVERGATSAVARHHLARLREIRAALERPLPEIEGVDLVGRVRRGTIGSPAVAVPGGGRRWWPVWATVALAGLGSLLLVLGGGRGGARRGEEFRAKSAARAAAAVPAGAGSLAERWAGIQAFRVGRSGPAQPLAGPLAPGDGLLFSYSNLGPQPLGFLMIFAIDAAGQVRWFHPGYQRAGADPVSIAVRSRAARVPLAELIRHDFPPGELTLYALFTQRPVRVSQVEELVGGARAAGAAPASVLRALAGSDGLLQALPAVVLGP